MWYGHVLHLSRFHFNIKRLDYTRKQTRKNLFEDFVQTPLTKIDDPLCTAFCTTIFNIDVLQAKKIKAKILLKSLCIAPLQH